MSKLKYLVTGATGHLGQKVVEELGKLVPKSQIVLGVHTIAKSKKFQDAGYEIRAIDYGNVTKMTQAFTGVDVIVYIPSITYNVKQRIDEFENSLEAIKKAGIHNLVDVSFIADQPNNPFQMAGYYAYLPARLAGSGLSYALVKNALYADPLVPYLPELIERHHLIYPIGDAKMSFISRQDSAEAIANVAIRPYLRNHGQNYILSMNHSCGMVELGRIMTAVTGKKIGYQPVTIKEFADIYRSEGDGDELASMYSAGAKGLLDRSTDDFRLITGHDPQNMKAFLANNYRK